MIARAALGWRPYALLVVLCLGLYLPGIAALPPLDRDEARFAQATRQMLESGDFLRIRFQDEARNKKPAGIYWLQAAAVAVFSDAASTAIWPYRLPSLLGATTAVLLTFALGAPLLGAPAALIGAALLASCLGLAVEAHLAKTDAVLLATVVAAQGALAAVFRAARRGGAPASGGWALLFWTAQGAGILVKGPVTPLVSGLTAAMLALADRDARWLKGLRPLWGVPLLLAIVGPWLAAITRATGGAFLGEAVGHDLLGKVMAAQESHGAPPGYYLALLAVTFWPGSLFLGPALVRAWQARRELAERFLIAWILPFWILLELVPTKLPHYVLPAYPALALLAGRALIAAADGRAARRPWIDRTIALAWALAGVAFAAVLVVAPVRLGEGPMLAGIVAAVVLLLLGARLLRRMWHGAAPGLVAGAAVLALLVFALTFQVVAPALDRLWLSRSAAALVARYRPPPDTPVTAVGYSEPSLVFFLGTRTRLVTPDEAAREMTSRRGAAALVSDRDDAAFRQALASRGWTPRVEGQVAGLDYSNGRQLVLTLYSGAPG